MYYILKNPAIWLVQSILGNQKKILPDVGFVIESQELK